MYQREKGRGGFTAGIQEGDSEVSDDGSLATILPNDPRAGQAVKWTSSSNLPMDENVRRGVLDDIPIFFLCSNWPKIFKPNEKN